MTRYALALAAFLAATPALASPVASGFNTTVLPANDDGYTGAVSLGFTANFFGQTYSSTYVSNNGYVTFGAGQGNYVPVGLGAGYTGNPIIAAFYDDVDTRGTGSGLTSYGTGTYAGRNAFGVTWPGVGYYSGHATPLDTFQIILTDRSDTGAGNFDIYLNYGSIGWERTDDTSSAAAGYNAGTGAAGSFFQIAGSLVPDAFLNGGANALNTGTNDGTPGQFEFSVRNGAVVPPTSVPEPASLALLGAGLLVLGGTAVRRRGA